MNRSTSRRNKSNNLVLHLIHRQLNPFLNPSYQSFFGGNVPPECIVPLDSIEDKSGDIRRCILLGFSRCCNFLISYCVPQQQDPSQFFHILVNNGNNGTFRRQQIISDNTRALGFNLVFWKFHFFDRLENRFQIPMLGYQIQPEDDIPIEFNGMLHFRQSENVEMTRRELSKFENDLTQHLPELALLANSASSGIPYSSLHVNLTESVDSKLFYNYLFCDLDEQERKHLICLMPSPIHSELCMKFSYLWGIVIEFSTKRPHPVAFLPLYCVTNLENNSIKTMTTKNEKSDSTISIASISTQLICIPSADCIDFIRYELKEQTVYQQNDVLSFPEMKSSINGTDTNLESNSCNECRLNKGSSENISISKVLYHRDHSIDPVAHFYLHVIQQDHLNIAEFINNNLSKNERIVDFDYRLISRIDCNEIILIIATDFIDKSASFFKKTRLILYCIIDIKRATVRTLEHNVHNEKKQLYIFGPLFLAGW
jgi:hypothetical protein